MKGSFEEAMRLTLGHEGGWYDGSEARDPNPTMYGVTQKVYDSYRIEKRLPLRTVREIEEQELHAIYRKYWDGTCEFTAEDFPRTTLCLFDMSINAGPVSARMLLQEALNQLWSTKSYLIQDGKIGPKTKAAITRAAGAVSDRDLCAWLLLVRVSYYDHLAQSARLRPNLKSWIGRTMNFYNSYIRKT